jgi:hypothetical protein
MSRITLVLLLVLASAVTSTAQAWQRVSTLTTTKNAHLVARSGGLILYDQNAVFRSSDNGQTWVDQSEKFPEGISASCVINGDILTFFPSGEPGMFNLARSQNGGETWSDVSNFDLPDNEELVGVEVFGAQLFAYSNTGNVQASWDGGKSWHQRRVGGSIGVMVDLAVVSGLWVACGTDGSAWSDDDGISWVPCVAPVEVGSGIHLLENWQGKIWGGGLIGAAEFDPLTRSWTVRNNVLFAVFQTDDGTSVIHRWTPSAGKWTIVNSEGLPRFNHAGSYQFTCSGERLYMYVHADDINYVGVYNALHDAPTGVSEEVVSTSAAIVTPQPASSAMTIRTGSVESMTLELVDMQGRVVRTDHFIGEAFVDVNDLVPGMYLLRLINASSFTHRLVVVQR